MNNIDKLKELTEELPPIPKLTDLIHNPGNKRNYIEYKVDNGICIGFGLLSQDEVAVQKVVMTKGTEFPWHDHESIEVITVFEGLIETECNGKTTVLKKGDTVKFDKTHSHTARALEDTWMIATLIPRTDGYPK